MATVNRKNCRTHFWCVTQMPWTSPVFEYKWGHGSMNIKQLWLWAWDSRTGILDINSLLSESELLTSRWITSFKKVQEVRWRSPTPSSLSSLCFKYLHQKPYRMKTNPNNNNNKNKEEEEEEEEKGKKERRGKDSLSSLFSSFLPSFLPSFM